MPSRQTDDSNWTFGNTLWRARVKLDCEEYYLGTFPTYKDAYEAEQDFRARMKANDERR